LENGWASEPSKKGGKLGGALEVNGLIIQKVGGTTIDKCLQRMVDMDYYHWKLRLEIPN